MPELFGEQSHVTFELDYPVLSGLFVGMMVCYQVSIGKFPRRGFLGRTIRLKMVDLGVFTESKILSCYGGERSLGRPP